MHGSIPVSGNRQGLFVSVRALPLVLSALLIVLGASFIVAGKAYADDSALEAGLPDFVSQQSADEGGLAAQAADQNALEVQAVTYKPMYRLYNPYSGEHFYTADKGERNRLVSLGWHYEGMGWMAPSEGDNVYRLYNPYTGDHHYTLSAVERDTIVKVGWRYEGVGWKSSASSDKSRISLYRQYNPYARVGYHNFTASKSENDHLVSVGWRAEGVGWYGHAIDSSVKDDMQPWSPKISGNYELDTHLEMIIRSHPTLWKCYEYVSDFPYISGNRFWSNPHYLPDSTTIQYALEMIRSHGGNCYRYACLMKWLAKGLGYNANVVSGWVPSYSGGRAPHGWVEVYQNGQSLVIDADMNHELRGYNWFMVTYGNAPTTYGSW